MTPSNALSQLFRSNAYKMPDPGAGATITVDRQLGVMSLVSVTAETRTLAAPTKAGIFFTPMMVTDGGDITFTVTGTYDGSNSVITFDTVEDWVTLFSIETSPGVFQWRVAAAGGTALGLVQTISNLAVTNLDAGASGTAGTIDVFPSTASRGKFEIAVTDQTGNTTVLQQVGAMGQATTVNLADPGAAAAYYVLSTAQLPLAEVDVLDNVTAGTVAASKAVVVNSDKDAGDFRNLDCVNLDAGSSGVAGTIDVFPSTASRGKFEIAVTDQTGNTTVTQQVGAMGQATTINLGDPGAAAAYYVLSTGKLTLAEVDVLDAVTPGTLAASKAIVVNSASHIDAINVTTLSIGASGAAVAVTATSAELNYCDVTTAGTLQANKAMVTDSNSAISAVKTAALHLGASGSETQVTATAAQLNSMAGALTGATALLAAGIGGSFSVLKTTAATTTLLAAHGTKDRACLVVVRVDETYDVGTGTLPTVKIGEDDTIEKCMAATVLDTEAAGTTLVYAFTNLATKKVIITSTAAVGNATGGCTVTVIAIPTT